MPDDRMYEWERLKDAEGYREMDRRGRRTRDEARSEFRKAVRHYAKNRNSESARMRFLQAVYHNDLHLEHRGDATRLREEIENAIMGDLMPGLVTSRPQRTELDRFLLSNDSEMKAARDLFIEARQAIPGPGRYGPPGPPEVPRLPAGTKGGPPPAPMGSPVDTMPPPGPMGAPEATMPPPGPMAPPVSPEQQGQLMKGGEAELLRLLMMGGR